MNELVRARQRISDLHQKQMAVDETRLLLYLAQRDNDKYGEEVYKKELEENLTAYNNTLKAQAEVSAKIARMDKQLYRYCLDAWYIKGVPAEEIKEHLNLSLTRIADIIKCAGKEYARLTRCDYE